MSNRRRILRPRLLWRPLMSPRSLPVGVLGGLLLWAGLIVVVVWLVR